MRKRCIKFLTISLTLFLSCTDSKKNQSDISDKTYLTTEESDYLKTRDDYIKYFKSFQKPGVPVTDTIYKQHTSALLDLEKRLRGILKDSHFSTEGKNNVETLFEELGFGMLDGLAIRKDSLTIFYTSKDLLSKYYKQNEMQLDELTPGDLELISFNAFISDAFLKNFSFLKINSLKNIRAYGMVGIVGQMTGPFLADRIYILVPTDKYVYMAEKMLPDKLTEIPKCRLLWDSLDLEGKKKLETLRTKGEVPFQKQLEIEDDVFDKYCDCYQNELKNDRQFASIQKQMELMATHLVKKE